MSNNRRSFLKKGLSMVAGAGVMILITTPKKAVANGMDIIVKPIFMAAARYYAGSWMKNTMDQLEKLGEWFGNDTEESTDQNLAVLGTATDGRNKIIKEIAENELLIETQPSPSSACSRSEVASVFNGIKKAAENSTRKNQQKIINAAEMIDSTNGIEIDKDIADMFASLSVEDLTKALSSGSFLTAHGYENSKHAERHKAAIANSLYTRILVSGNKDKNPKMKSVQQHLISHINVLDESLVYLFNRRVRAKTISSALRAASNETELNILTRLERETGKMSIIDVERFEVERTYLNTKWQDEIVALQSFTALSKEMADLHSLGNKMDVELLNIQELINQISSISCLTEIDDSVQKNKYRSAVV